jgi:hypothetical protein
VADYLADILQACKTRACFRVLIEERLDGPRLNATDVFGLAAQASERALGILQAVAYVDINARGRLMQFAENVATNRALPVAVFQTVAEAERWLLSR